jgi:hypothetical protein
VIFFIFFAGSQAAISSKGKKNKKNIKNKEKEKKIEDFQATSTSKSVFMQPPISEISPRNFQFAL